MALTHYGTLGVDRTASQEEIRAAYRALASQHHPDRGGDHETMAGITVAYEWLSGRREEYDSLLELVGTACGKCGSDGRTYKQKGFGARVPVRCKACNGEGYVEVRGVTSVVKLGGTARRKRR